MSAKRALGERIGRLLFFRDRGQSYYEMFKGWITPIFVGAGGMKFLGLGTTTAILLAIAIPIGVLVLSLVLGWLDWRLEVAKAHYRWSSDNNPYQVEQLALLREIRTAVQRSRLRGVPARVPFIPGGTAGAADSREVPYGADP